MPLHPDAVIVGDLADPHVAAVVGAAQSRGSRTAVFDAASLASQPWDWKNGQFRLAGAALSGRGWIRRLHPADWQTGTRLGSLEAAEATAWLQMLAGVVRSAEVVWLTPLDPAVAAENKLVQDVVARRVGVAVPGTTIATRAPTTDCVVKPLGPGHFVDATGAPWAVPALRVTPEMRTALPSAPFLWQEPLSAVRHLRIVTVGSRAWCAALDAEDLPLDWRRDEDAHFSFQVISHVDAAHDAVRMAGAMGVGYSSQDWLETAHGLYFLDLNPSGQWLFLPGRIADQVTHALADWLMDAS